MGKYNKLREIKNPDKEITYICFTDQSFKSKTWKIIKGSSIFSNMNLNAKIHKILPHLYFNCDYSLWVDGSIEIYGDIKKLIELSFNDGTDICLFKHKVRDCPYCEANVIISSNLVDPEKIREQMNNYQKNGLKIHSGLSQGGVILRKHSKEMELFNMRWWSEICRYTKRDQLSLDYCISKTGLNLKHFNLPKLYDDNGYFKYYGHNKNISHIITLLKISIADGEILNISNIIQKLKEKILKIIYQKLK
jgi:hypothetical protein